MRGCEGSPCKTHVHTYLPCTVCPTHTYSTHNTHIQYTQHENTPTHTRLGTLEGWYGWIEKRDVVPAICAIAALSYVPCSALLVVTTVPRSLLQAVHRWSARLQQQCRADAGEVETHCILCCCGHVLYLSLGSHLAHCCKSLCCILCVVCLLPRPSL